MKIHSMTAFASAERLISGWQATWEIRSVNHRFLDLSFRLPDAFRFVETVARAQVGSHVKRGRLELNLTLKKDMQEAAQISIDTALIEELIHAMSTIEHYSKHCLSPCSPLELLRWPGVLKESDVDKEALQPQLLDALEEALKRLVASRENEGRQLALLIQERCEQIRAHIAKTQRRIPEILHFNRQRLQARLAELAARPEPDRLLEQEMVYLAQKLDVSEELDRLNTHLDEVTRTLRLDEAIGKRLDFLAQEMHREANTLGSKSADSETTLASVEIKVLIEQIREQIQNIE
ncbi:YicC family protein [Candidatus Methylospira mobilis]|uniref:YicC family protein n=1 Tax=Candidatus Methylospira mobilis TaxID=1808979 RepID=A0A5Q0BIZ3_9GAMM|nr:YicC/YloC family endoribonuclease [Candidatus Methylospira mobilis]QFY43845.1 YicC family protein [Candidatus Methylospira mobilis]WNV04839.1 YicC/YloC family endoribonuclease [Candidatus Methylospira mobilis]